MSVDGSVPGPECSPDRVLGAAGRADLPEQGRARVLVPRGGRPGRELAAALESAGFEPVVAPLITFGPPVDAAPLLAGVVRLAEGGYDWLVLTSERTVDALVDASPAGVVQVPATTRVAAVGPSTARRARRAGFDVDVVPEWDRTATGLLAALAGTPADPADPTVPDNPADPHDPSAPDDPRRIPHPGSSLSEPAPQWLDSRSDHLTGLDRLSDHSPRTRATIDSGSVQLTGPDRLSSRVVRAFAPRSAIARPELVDGLRAAGWHVDAPDAYVTELATELPAGALDVDVVVLTSSSTAETWATLTGHVPAPPWRVVSIGPRTTTTARTFGLRVKTEATTPDVPALVAAVQRVVAPSPDS